MASASSNSWPEKFENIYRDLKELWLDTQDVMQLANPRYGLLTRFDNLDDETKAKLASIKVKTKSYGRTEEVPLYISKYDAEEVKTGITTIQKMGLVFSFQNLEQFVHQLFEASICYIMETTYYVKGPNLVFWQQAIYLCGASSFDGSESNDSSSTAKELYAYLKHQIKIDEEINEGSSVDYLNFIKENFLPMEDSHLIIFEFLTRMRLEKLKTFRVESILEAIMDILPFEFQSQNGVNGKQSKCNLKSNLMAILEFLLQYSKSERSQSGDGAQNFDSFFINKENDIYFMFDQNECRKRFYIRPINIKTLQNLINLYYELSLIDHRDLQMNAFKMWRFIGQEKADFNISVRCELADIENEKKYPPTPESITLVEARLSQIWNNARTNQNEKVCDYETYINARDFSKYFASLIGKLVTVIMMVKFKEFIARIPHRDPHHRSKLTNPNRDNLPRTASIFGLEAKDIDAIARGISKHSNINLKEALK